MASQQPHHQQQQQQQSLSAESATVNQVRLFGSSWTLCGYCHGERAQTVLTARGQQQQQQQDEVGREQTAATAAASSKAYSILATSLTPALYEAFIERGWRRSGRCLYKPDNWVSCCPLLSIRLPVQEFAMSKSQRKVLKRMERLLVLSSSSILLSSPSQGIDGTTKTTAFDVNATTTCAASAPARAPADSDITLMTAILEQLESWTNEALQEILAGSASDNDGNNSTMMMMQIADDATGASRAAAPATAATSSSNATILPRAKFTFRKIKQKKASRQSLNAVAPQSPGSVATGGPTAGAVVSSATITLSTCTAVTTVCAMIAGKSKGQIDRSALSQRLVQVLQSKASSCSTMLNTGKRRRQNSKGEEDGNKTGHQHEEQPAHHHQSSETSSPLPPPFPLHAHAHDLQVERQHAYLHQRSSSSSVMSNHELRLSSPPTSDRLMMIQSIERHEASGQVMVQLQLPTTTNATASLTTLVDDDACSSSSSNPQPMVTDESTTSSSNNNNARSKEDMSTSNEGLNEVAAGATKPSSPTTGPRASLHTVENSDDKLAVWWETESKQRQRPPLQLTTTVAPIAVAAAKGGFASNSSAAMGTCPAAAPPLPPLSQIQQRDRKLTVETMPAHESALDPQVHRLYAYYQHAIHHDPDPFILPVALSDDSNIDDPWWWGNHDNTDGTAATAMDSADQQAPTSTPSFAAKAPNGWAKQLFRAMSQTYRNWPETSQRRIMHHYGQFYDFLVDHPFCNNNSNTTTTSMDPWASSNSGNATATNGASFEMGIHHQQYRINGYLIAVGVVDILPRGLSSVYLFYDPSFSQHLVPLGTFSSLREIVWARDVARLPSYYLGYYIHSNTKMRYKANFKPSQLLCPESYQWVPANIAQERIERLSPLHHCCRLVPTDEMDDGDAAAAAAAERRLVMEQELKLEVGFGQVVQLVQLQEAARTFLRPFLSDFIEQAGPAVSRQCVIDFR